MLLFIQPTSRIATAAFWSWQRCSGCFPSCKSSSPTAAIKVRNSPPRSRKRFRTSMLKLSNDRMRWLASNSCLSAGLSNAPLLGLIDAAGLPRIGRISTARRWLSCASLQSASCSENSAIQPKVSGQTLGSTPILTTYSRTRPSISCCAEKSRAENFGAFGSVSASLK